MQVAAHPYTRFAMGYAGRPARAVVQKGLGALGDDWLSNLTAVANPSAWGSLIKEATAGVNNLVAGVSGQTAQSQAQAQAVALAQARSQQAVAEAQASSMAWSKAIPWVAGSVAALGLAYLVLKK